MEQRRGNRKAEDGSKRKRRHNRTAVDAKLEAAAGFVKELDALCIDETGNPYLRHDYVHDFLSSEEMAPFLARDAGVRALRDKVLQHDVSLGNKIYFTPSPQFRARQTVPGYERRDPANKKQKVSKEN